MKLLTDIELRSHWFATHEKEYEICGEVSLTPAAQDFVREHGILLVQKGKSGQPVPQFEIMPMSPIPSQNGTARYVDAATGRGMTEKPENMTHLHGNVLVPKSHPRIAFRGKLDSLEAKIISVQVLADVEGLPALSDDLDELLKYCRTLLGSEVKETPMPQLSLLGLDSAGLRRVSHHVQEEIGIPHPTPCHTMGRLCAELNCLRTQVRETELSAVAAFCENGGCSRPDIIEGLNRLSSAVYILFCRKVAGYYDKGAK